MSDYEFDVIIIGGGPAGLTSAIFTARYGLSTLIIEKGLLGGYLHFLDDIENYPGFLTIKGSDLGNILTEQAKKYGASTIIEEAKSIRIADKRFIIDTKNENLLSSAVIIATGSNPAKIGVKGEEEYFGRGVSYCAKCDGPLFKGKAVLVVGGGNSAITEALFIANYVSKIYILNILEDLQADFYLQNKIKSVSIVEFLLPYKVETIEGDDRVNRVVVRSLKTNSIKEIMVDGVFVFIGRIPASQPFRDLIKTDEKGFIITDENLMTSQKGIFSAGDVRSKTYLQIATALGDGCIAGLSASNYLLTGKV
ncbi:MAG: NAD(P)/FAD-dependent oxidoreductase [bacterium]